MITVVCKFYKINQFIFQKHDLLILKLKLQSQSLGNFGTMECWNDGIMEN